MNKETYESLQRVMEVVLSELPSWSDKGESIKEDIKIVFEWMDEVSKEIE